MKKLLSIVAFCFFWITGQAQTMKPYTVGHPFTISLPDYMAKTSGINNSAAIQYKSEVKDVYGFVILDDKEGLKLAELNYSSIKEFYDEFIKGFIEGEEQLKQSKPVSTQQAGVNFVESDLSFFDKEAKTEIYYLVGIVETKKGYYTVLSYCTLENKAKFKEDFRKILYSLRD